MAPYEERPFPRGRRRVASRRTGTAPARRTPPAEAAWPHPGWEEPLVLPDAPADDPFAEAGPTIVPPEVADTPDPVDERAVVVVATTPGAPAPQVAPPLTPAPRAPTPRATARRTTAPGGVAAGAAAPPVEDAPVDKGPAVNPSGGPDPSSELGRMFSRLLVRMANVERRLDGFDERLQASPAAEVGPAPEPSPAEEAQDAEREYDRQMLTWLADRVEALTAELEEQRRQGEGTTLAVQDTVGRAQALSGEIATLQAQVGDLASSREDPGQPVGYPEHELLAPAVADLQREAAAAGEWALGLEARMAQLESLPSVIADVATDQFHRLAAELPSAPVDMEAVYKELDSVAEVLAARDAAVAHGLEQVQSLEAAVSSLGDDFVRLVDELAASRAAEEEAHERLRALQRRMDALESPERQMERLSSALDTARGLVPGRAGFGGARPAGIRVADGVTTQPGPDATSSSESGGEPPQRAIQALAADLDRIRRSLEVLAEGAPPAG